MTKWWLGAFVLAALGAIEAAQEPAPKQKPGGFEVAEDGTVTVRGKVTFTDHKHDVREKVRGSVRTMLWYADEEAQIGSGTEIEIVDGMWTATFRRPEHAGKRPGYVSFVKCKVGDSPVILETDRLDLAEGTDFVLRLRAIPELRLRVVDAETKKELDRIEVFLSHGWEDAGTLHPGSTADLRPVVEAGKSPFIVPPPEEVSPGATGKLWIRAPGYAWTAVEVMYAEGGKREAALVRAGAANVAISGKLPRGGKVALRFHRAGEAEPSRPLLEVPVAGTEAREIAIEDVAPGKYEARLELGEWFRQPRVLARAQVEIEAGKTAAVPLAVEKEVATPERVTVRGIVSIPAGWMRAGKRVSIELAPLTGTDRWAETQWLHGDELRRGEKEGEYRFAFPGTVVGRYVLKVDPSSHQKLVRLGKEGFADLRIEVPEPVEVVVRVVDRETKKPRNGVQLAWHPPWPPGVTGGSLESAQAAADSNEVRFLAPAGRIEVGAFGEEYVVKATRLDVSADEREFEVFADTSYGVKVALYEGTTRIPIGFGSGWNLSLFTVDGAPAFATESSGQGDQTFTVTTSGTYVLRVTAPAGYLPVADRQVKLAAPPFPTIDIKVARK